MSEPATTEPIVLVGLMGAGKTSVGRVLAGRLGRPFVDLDEVIEATSGSSVREVFDSEGEAGFRAREAAALGEVLARTDGPVVATGGGVVTTPGNLEFLRHCTQVVWLRADVPVLAARVEADGSTRPLLAGSAPIQALARLVDERAPRYAEVADAVVDTDGLEPEAVAAAVVEALDALVTEAAP